MERQTARRYGICGDAVCEDQCFLEQHQLVIVVGAYPKAYSFPTETNLCQSCYSAILSDGTP
jgi:hypothetical protein